MAVSPRSSPAAPSTSEPVQTDVVNRVVACAWRTHSRTWSSCCERPRADAAGEDDHVGLGSSSKVASAIRPSMPFSLRTLAAGVPTKVTSMDGMRWRTS